MKNLLYLSIFVFLVGCTNRNKYLTGDYLQYSKGHKTIAILPYDIIITGNYEMTEDEFLNYKYREASLFQNDLYSEVLKRTGYQNDDIQISVQPIQRTNRLLKEAELEGNGLSQQSIEEIGKLLDVDAVLIGKVVKDRILSAEAALALDFVKQNIPNVLNLPNSVNVHGVTKKGDVQIFADIVDVSSERPIWHYENKINLSWDEREADAVRRINGRISRNFPYR